MSNQVTKAQFGRETGDDGSFQRQKSAFRDWVKEDGTSEFPVEAGRYHLYVSAACPWAHRAIIFRKLVGLESAMDMTIVDPLRDEKGWRFGAGDAETGERDPLHNWTYLSEGYKLTDPAFEGRVTVPVLWDKTTGQIVCNESSDIIRMFDQEFRPLASNPDYDFYPEHMRAEIDAVNEWVYSDINNGVYRCGFAVTQHSYEKAFNRLFDALDRCEQILSDQRYIAGNQITEADWRLFTTLVRFDSVYVSHFKCNRKRIVDYPNLWAYARELYQVDGIAETVNHDHIKRHYYVTHTQINPTQVVPAGPEIDWLEPHGRS